MGKWTRVTSVVGAALMLIWVLAGCGGSSAGGGNKNIVIATLLPVSGTSAALGLPTQYGTDLAVSQNKDLGSGYTLTVQNENYQGASGADPAAATAAANKLINDPKVIAMVGPFNSGITKVTMPITNSAGLVSISPANTNPGLTLREYAAANSYNFDLLHPAGKPDAYFRLPGNDVVQGKVDAAIISGAPISAKSVYVIDDNTVYGKGLANFFTTSFQATGGTVLDRQSFTAQQVSSAGSFADTIKAKNPDAVFFGGTTDSGVGAVKKALVSKGFTKPWVGGDGIADDSAWLQTAGDGAGDTYGSVAAPDPASLSNAAAQKFVTDYKAFVSGKPNNDLVGYSAMSYDSAMIIITAVKSLISAGKDVTRANVRDQIAGINYSGVTGQVSFDANGDNAGPKVFAIYRVDPSTKQWVYQSTVNG
ncbi:MAG TPA: branched-chain amino acid ABC transporter substrate-binding protein [Ktedonobacterales bacterium]|jgi:branched-chain amino acid transport system substrate-binding protein|nr:branched-chain amino acid ABC transporter substrate-binding protein [Ktedonobacterales bacterium]